MLASPLVTARQQGIAPVKYPTRVLMTRMEGLSLPLERPRQCFNLPEPLSLNTYVHSFTLQQM